jgi:hypothetical protein
MKSIENLDFDLYPVKLLRTISQGEPRPQVILFAYPPGFVCQKNPNEMDSYFSTMRTFRNKIIRDMEISIK